MECIVVAHSTHNIVVQSSVGGVMGRRAEGDMHIVGCFGDNLEVGIVVRFF